jgi:L-aspartate oxidase
MAEAGVPLTNEGYMQFMWHSMPERKFFKISRIAEPGMKVISPRGEKLSLPEAAGNPAAQRSSHCPYAFGREDSFLDRFLFANLNGAGAVEVRGAGGVRLLLSPLAHAANGGALIDEHGRTGASGLLAAGECAAGMHGANRLGGAMVAAALVFGSRAGKTAALECREDVAPAKTFTSLTIDTLVQREINAGPEPAPLPPISEKLHGHVALEGSESLQEAADFLYERKTSAAGRKEKLALEGALLMVRFLLRNRSLSD